MVEARHHLIAEGIYGILYPRLLSVYQELYLQVVGFLAYMEEARPYFLPLFFFFGRERGFFLYFLEQLEGGNAREFEYRKGYMGGLGSFFDGANDLLGSRLKSSLVFFAFYRVVEDGADIVFGEFLDGFAAFFNVFATAEVLKHCFFDKPIDRQSQAKS